MVARLIQIMQKDHNAPFSRSANRRVADMLHCLQQSIVKEERIEFHCVLTCPTAPRLGNFE